MSDLFQKTHRPEITEPQLATMIDVFSILIIFLIAGTVMGPSAINLPAGINPPKSTSKEVLVASPQLTITQDQVTLDFSAAPFPLKAFLDGDSGGEVQRFRAEVKDYEKKSEGKENAGLINLVADHGTTYDKIFPVIKVAREAGAQSILFISTARHNK